MEPIYENYYGVIEETYIRWTKIAPSRKYKRAFLFRLILLIFGLALTVLASGLLIYAMILGASLRNYLFLNLLLLLFFLYELFFRGKRIARARYRQLRILQQGEKWYRRIVFDEERITVTDNNTVSTYAYSQITAFQVVNEYGYLSIGGVGVIAVKMNRFQTGDPQRFLGFLEERCENLLPI